jgi:hypothetical protein
MTEQFVTPEMLKKISKSSPIYPGNTVPLGLLPEDDRAQACWHFYMIAEFHKDFVGESIDDQKVYEGEAWRYTHYRDQKKGVAMMYDIDDPAEMDKFWFYVGQETRRIGFPLPSPEYMGAGSSLLI